MNTTISANNPTGIPAALRHPSAFLPIAMSLIALSLVLFHINVYGTAREPDEGAIAHLWQLLMGVQIPIIGFFAIRWFPRSARSATATLALQFVAALAAVAPLWDYHL